MKYVVNEELKIAAKVGDGFILSSAIGEALSGKEVRLGDFVCHAEKSSNGWGVVMGEGSYSGEKAFLVIYSGSETYTQRHSRTKDVLPGVVVDELPAWAEKLLNGAGSAALPGALPTSPQKKKAGGAAFTTGTTNPFSGLGLDLPVAPPPPAKKKEEVKVETSTDAEGTSITTGDKVTWAGMQASFVGTVAGDGVVRFLKIRLADTTMIVAASLVKKE